MSGVSRRYEDLTGPQVREVLSPTSILVLPVGAIEQHGPHLPMSVDAVIAHEMATAVVAACGDELDVWQLPTLSVSKSNEHAWSPGTLYLSPETMLAVLRDLGRSVASTGVGMNVAIPHVKLPGLEEPVFSLCLAPDGIEWSSVDGEPAKIIFAVLRPERASETFDPERHLEMMRWIAALGRDSDFRNFARAASTRIASSPA